MKKEQKALAVDLRINEQLSLKDIANRTGLSKATLSVLLRDFPLSSERLKHYRKSSQLAGANTNKIKSAHRRESDKQIGRQLIYNNPRFKDLCLLYWGEGSKYKTNKSFVICNADPQMIKYIADCLKAIDYYEEAVCVAYCYPHYNLADIEEYWKDILGKEIKSYVVKNSTASKKKRIDKIPYGTLRVQVNRIKLLDMVLGGIEELKNMRD